MQPQHQEKVGESRGRPDLDQTSILVAAYQALLDIHGLTSPAALAAIGAQNPAQQVGAAQLIIENVRRRIDAAQDRQVPFQRLSHPLTPEQYAMPPELREVHTVLLQHLRSALANESYGYAGLLLHGVKGTGKSEYPYLLSSLLGDKAEIVTVEVSSVRNTPGPGEALTRLYHLLEERAQRLGTYQVRGFDEFDQLVMANAEVYSHEHNETTDYRSGKHGSSRSVHQLTSQFKLAAIGQALLTHFKRVLGSREIQRVFTIATSNLPDFPEPIYREGRFQRIELRPYALKGISFGEREAHLPMYDTYRHVLPQVISVMQATHERTLHTQNPVLQELHAEVAQLFGRGRSFEEFFRQRSEQLAQLIGYISLEERFTPYFKENAERLRAVLDFLGFPFEKLSPSAAKDFAFLRSGCDDRKPYVFREQPEYAASLKLVPSTIALHYKQNQDAYTSQPTAKTALARLQFPQLENERVAV